MEEDLKGFEPFSSSGGCYGNYAPPGVYSKFGPSLRTSAGAIHWAGTETAVRWTGYIDGAISSGERAAEEVIDAENKHDSRYAVCSTQ